VDVIAVQEAFDGSSRGDLIDAFKDRGYPFASKVPEFGGIEPVDGGVFIVSRWPIVSMESSPYSGTGTGFDFFSAKGYSYALINKLGKNYHVFCTHLQSDNVPKALEQLTELRTFVNSRVGTNPANDAVVIAGDMNIDMESEPSDYRSMLSRLNAIFPNPPRPVGSSSSSVRFRWTADSTTNDIKSARDSALSQSWLDYILFSQPGQLPSRASWEVKEYETSPKFKMAVKAYNASKTEHHDLSDHSAVIGTFRMPYSGPPVSSGETIEVAFDIASKNARDVPDLAITLDGVTLGPKERRDLIAGIGYRISVPEIAASSRPGCRHRFLDWTNGGAPEHVFTAAKEVTKMVATYVEECEVTGIVDPPGSGAIDGLGWKEVGKRATMIATPAAGFEFVEITGIKAEGNVASDRITEPTIVTAKFRAVELPALNAVSVGPRGDGGAGVRNVPLAIRNNGPGGATNVRITEVVNLMTTGGSGVASFASPLPVSFGAVPAGGASAPTMVQFTWPATVTRLQFTVRFTADGYSGSTTLNLVR
jgi:endonuclease/exonuclease/phosphatase family metal-dependent hydrolase